ncbi:hypothetical protein ACWGIU_17040 [Streptomyces sp. NPDC054840]
MPGSAARLATLLPVFLRALLIVSAPAAAAPAAAAWAAPVGSADSPADVVLAIGLTAAAAAATGWLLRSRVRRDCDGGDP